MKKYLIVFTICLTIILTACSNNYTSDKAVHVAEDREMQSLENEASDFQSSDGDGAEEADKTSTNRSTVETTNNQMIIYTGFIEIEVSDYNKTVTNIINKVNELNGFIVKSNEYQHRVDENRIGEIVVRIPDEHFHSFMNHVEDSSTKVLSKTTSGNDVTEEYVDLQSRLRSKQAVEERLLSFMKEAEKTDDLLKISNDLARVQEEIEQIKGRMNYLENHVAFSTITINIQEKAVIIPEIKNTSELNTMENATKLFFETINAILNVFSKFIVLLIGYSPIIVPLLIFALIILIRRKKLSDD